MHLFFFEAGYALAFVEVGDAAAVGLAEVVGGEGGGDGAGGDDFDVEEGDPVEVFGGGLEVVVDDDDGFAAGAEFAEDGDDGAFGDGVDGGEGFVHEIDAGVLDEGAGEEGTLLLAAGELADLAVGEVLHADLFEGVHGGFAFALPGAADPAEAAVEAHGDDVEDGGGEVPVDAAALGDVADEAADLFVGLAVEPDCAGGAGDELEGGLDEGAFAGAVGADYGHEDAFGHAQVDVPDGGFAVVGDGQVVDLKGRSRAVLRVTSAVDAHFILLLAGARGRVSRA